MKQKQITLASIVLLLILAACAYIVTGIVTENKAEADDFYTSYPMIASIEASAQHVEAPKLNKLADVVKPAPQIPVEAPVELIADEACHITVPAGTTVSTLEAIQTTLVDAGCSVKSWFSSIKLPSFGADVADNQ